MPEKTWQQWLIYGLLPLPGPDGNWDEDEVSERISAAKALETEARSLPRRALHLQRVGYPVAGVARRAAVVEVLRRVRPAARKMRQVRREMDALARRASLGPPPRKPRSFGIGLPRADWVTAVQETDGPAFDAHYANAARWAEITPISAEALGIKPLVSVSFDERVALLVVNLIVLHEAEVREKLRLPPRPSGGPAIKQ